MKQFPATEQAPSKTIDSMANEKTLSDFGKKLIRKGLENKQTNKPKKTDISRTLREGEVPCPKVA